MKNIFYLLWFILLFTFNGRSQEWEWANHFSFSGSEAKSVIGGTDNAGNVYCAVRSTAISANLFHTEYNLLKIDPKGKMVWSKDISAYAQAAMVTDLAGNTFLAISDKMAKVNADGQFIWEKNTNGENFFYQLFLLENVLGVCAADKDGKPHVETYSFEGNLISKLYQINPGFSSISKDFECVVLGFADVDPVTGNSARLWKYSNSGELQFEIAVPYRPSDIVIDRDNAIYITGYFGVDAVEIAGIKFAKPNIPNDYTNYQYLIKFDTNGKLLWYKIMTGGGSESIRLKLDENNDLYYLTDYWGESKFSSETVNQNMDAGLLLLKIKQNGEVSWFKKVPFSLLNAASAENCYVTKKGDVFVTGQLTGSVMFDNLNVISQDGDYAEMFVAKLSQNSLVNVPKNTSLPDLWQIFPNPSGDVFRISGDNEEELNISLTNAHGQLIRSETLRGAEKDIDLSSDAKGVYLLQIRSGSRTETKKLVKN